jgi:DNA-binding MarR family transcriptional regulator/GNAT superfamily N-acetyltransferase
MATMSTSTEPDTEFDSRIEAVREFNRFHTRKIGVLNEGLHGGPFSLTEARVLYELATRKQTIASELASELRIDPGYVSRILRGFGERGLIDRQPSDTDARQSVLSLTEEGRHVYAGMNELAREDIADLLRGLSQADQQRLVAAMRSITELLEPTAAGKVSYLLRPHRPGDLGWVVHRHGVVYAEEYGWDERFEALVADIAARFIAQHDPKRERCWLAEVEGEIVGSVFLVKKSEKVAQLRLLLVEPKARGLGIGRRLVDETVRFARQAGYKKIVLWTNSILLSARRIYERAGFRLVRQEPEESFGSGLIAETWELDL